MSDRRTRLACAVVVAAGVGLLYRDVFVKLVHDWATDGNASHGFLIGPLAAYLAWERRRRFEDAAMRPSLAGLAAVAASIGVLATGVLGSELFLTRVSLIGVLAGAVLFLFGWQRLRVMAFPLAFLVLMVPLPAIVLNQVTFPLQLIASQVGEFGLSLLRVPVLREGNVLVLSTTSLEVAEACSGIRSLVSLLTLAIVFAYFTDPRGWVRTTIALSTVPVAILSNGIRVTWTGLAVEWFGPSAARGVPHEVAGWLVFVVAMGMMFLIHRALSWVRPVARPLTAPAWSL